MASAAPPVPATALAVSSAVLASRSSATIFIPAQASSAATTRPISPPPPVISATREDRPVRRSCPHILTAGTVPGRLVDALLAKAILLDLHARRLGHLVKNFDISWHHERRQQFLQILEQHSWLQNVAFLRHDADFHLVLREIGGDRDGGRLENGWMPVHL